MENDLFKQKLIELLTEILAEQKNGGQKPVTSYSISLEDLIDSVDVKSILQISKSTLYRLKTASLVQTIRIGKRDYYSRIAIEKMINFFKK